MFDKMPFVQTRILAETGAASWHSCGFFKIMLTLVAQATQYWHIFLNLRFVDNSDATLAPTLKKNKPTVLKHAKIADCKS
jgi:hypothetical protein